MGIRVELDYTRQQIKQELTENGIRPTPALIHAIVYRMIADARNSANDTLVDCIQQVLRGESLAIPNDDLDLVE